MTSRPDITKPENMLAIQGDLVLVYKHEGDAVVLAYVLTLVRVMDVGRQEMRLCNRASKDRKPDWPFTQAWYDRLKPARDNKEGAKWEVTLKPK
jgi:hypothetical protein